MISWIIVAILIVVGVIALKMNHLRHRVLILLLVFLALFLYISVLMISEKNELDLSTSNGVMSALKVYAGWLANGFENMKTLTTRAIDMDWTSANGTFIKEEAVNGSKNLKKELYDSRK